ncbi:hypothetical protein D3C75_1079890 [compost metagenome]
MPKRVVVLEHGIQLLPEEWNGVEASIGRDDQPHVNDPCFQPFLHLGDCPFVQPDLNLRVA